MPETSKIIGGNLVTNPIGERIEDDYIHIYPSAKMTIRLARSFIDELRDLGYKPVERTDDRTTLVDLPVGIIYIGSELMISFYRHDLGEKMGCVLHNQVIENIPREIQEALSNKVDVVSRVKWNGPAVTVGELPQVIHLYFDMKDLEKLGKKEEKLDSWFGD